MATDVGSITISSTIQADCSISVNTSQVVLGSISATDVRKTVAGNLLVDTSGSFTVTPTCVGAAAGTLTLSTSGGVADGYLMTSDGSDYIRFKIEESSQGEFESFDSTSKSVSLGISGANLSAGNPLTFNVLGIAGANSSSAMAGTYSSTLNIELAAE